MWNPPNKDALPSLKERKSAEEAIRQLESVLEEAVEAMEKAQLRVLILRQELDSRRAWLAPIRKLPVEILSYVFILNSKMEALAPVRITEVCRFWRQIVLSTPRAWSLIYLGETTPCTDVASYTSTYLSRSDPCLLHMWIPQHLSILKEKEGEEGEDEENEEEETRAKALERPYPFLSIISTHSHRLKCLSISGHQLALSDVTFPNLTSLSVEICDDYVDPTIDLSRFPLLSSLYLSYCFLTVPVGAKYPPLQCLTIYADENRVWIQVIQGCSCTLKALDVYGSSDEAHTRITITLPILEYLEFNNHGPVFHAITPALVTYKEIFNEPGPPLDIPHTNIQGVTHLRTSNIRNLVDYSSLLFLQLKMIPPPDEAIDELTMEIFKLLGADPDICAALETIEICKGNWMDSWPRLKRRVEKAIHKRNSRPNVTVTLVFQPTRLPGSPENANCDPGMPCMLKGDPDVDG